MRRDAIGATPFPSVSAGFTVVELMITVTVAAVLLAIAVPSFSSILTSNRLVGQSNGLVTALQTARSEAVRRNSRAVVCRSVDLATCADGANWTGWIAGLDTNNDGTIDEVLQVGNIKAPVQVLASSNIVNSRVTFRPDGFAQTNAGALLDASLGVCIPTRRPAENVRAVSIRAGSRIATKALNGAGACAAPVNAP